jgi:hypothetical protein
VESKLPGPATPRSHRVRPVLLRYPQPGPPLSDVSDHQHRRLVPRLRQAVPHREWLGRHERCRAPRPICGHCHIVTSLRA